MESDALRPLRNFYYLGLYENVISEAESIKATNPLLESLVDVYLYRAYLEIDPQVVFTNIKENAPTCLRAVKLLGTYRTANEDTKELVFETLNEWLSYPMIHEDQTLQTIAATIFVEEGNYKKALKLLVSPGENLEKMTIEVQLYLKMDRVDLAAKVIKTMADVDDDDPLTQLSTAWVYIAQRGDKISEAFYILQELIEKFGQSVSVLNSLAVCQLHLKNFSQAFQFLKKARNIRVEKSRKAHPDTLVNTIVCLQHMRKPAEIIAKITAELEDANPENVWLKNQHNMSEVFDKHAKDYSI